MLEQYRKVAKHYDQGMLRGCVLPQSLRRAAVKMSQVKPGESVLDLCTGTGQAARWFAAAGASVTGIDLSPDMLAIARSKHPDITFEIMDASNLCFPDGSFDLANAQVCLHEMPVPVIRQTLLEMRRVTRRVVILAEPYVPVNRFLRLVVRYLWLLEALENSRWKDYTKMDLRQTIREAGLKIVLERSIACGLLRIYLCRPSDH